jgi:hypothetical protein
MTAHISPTDLKLLDTEPRVQDLTLADALGFEDRHKIRDLIRRNSPELANHGEVCAIVAQTTPPREGVSATVAETPSKNGRPGTEYWLNEPQSLLICMFSRTDKAADVRKEIIEVFLAWRRGHHPPALPGPVPSTGDSIGGEPLAVVTAKLGIVRESRLIHGVERARILWDRLGLPAVPGGPELAAADGCAALAHLLDTLGAGRDIHLGLRLAFNDDADAQGFLRELGLRIMEDQDGVVIGNNHPAVLQAFQGSRWDKGRHVAALRHVPGAHKTGPMKFSTITAHRGVFVPMDAVEQAAPAA